MVFEKLHKYSLHHLISSKEMDVSEILHHLRAFPPFRFYVSKQLVPLKGVHVGSIVHGLSKCQIRSALYGVPSYMGLIWHSLA